MQTMGACGTESTESLPKNIQFPFRISIQLGVVPYTMVYPCSSPVRKQQNNHYTTRGFSRF